MPGIGAKSHIMENQPPGSIGGTYGSGPIACAAASATLKVQSGHAVPASLTCEPWSLAAAEQVIKDENLLANATARGSQLVKVSQAASRRARSLNQQLTACLA